jgi:glutamate-1-semialdehyde 2,1-aminomutase
VTGVGAGASRERKRLAPRLGSARALEFRERSHALIPSGAHTYAKADDQFPEPAPGLIVRGRGCHVWDVDDNEFIEYAMGMRAVTLGHAYPEVVQAAYDQMLLGNNFTRPATIELDCAESLLGLIAAADMVKFTKDGSSATTAAVKLARAFTGRDLVAACADHPFFSYDDWFIGTTAIDAGIPEAHKSLTLTFRYNDLAGVEALFDEHPDRIACVILEPEKSDPPRDDFLHRLQELCRRNGTMLILDETITGFRWHLGGAQGLYGLAPDLSVFGKAMANGFSVSALVGRRELMELGGLRHSGKRVFLLSTTHGAENPSLAAAIATMRIYREQSVVETLHEKGDRLRADLDAAAQELGIADYFHTVGRSSNLQYVTRDLTGQPSQPFRTLFLQEMVGRGIIAPTFVMSVSHDDDDLDYTVEAAAEALAVYAKALESGVDRFLRGPAVKSTYREYN